MTARKISLEIAKRIKRPNDPSLSVSDINRSPVLRGIILKGTGQRSVNAFLHELRKRNLMEFLPQLNYNPSNRQKWVFCYFSNTPPEIPQRHKWIERILNNGFELENELELFTQKELDLLNQYFDSLKGLLHGSVPNTTEKRESFIHFHKVFLKNKNSRRAKNYFEKLWLKFLIYRMYIDR